RAQSPEARQSHRRQVARRLRQGRGRSGGCIGRRGGAVVVGAGRGRGVNRRRRRRRYRGVNRRRRRGRHGVVLRGRGRAGGAGLAVGAGRALVGRALDRPVLLIGPVLVRGRLLHVRAGVLQVVIRLARLRLLGRARGRR